MEKRRCANWLHTYRDYILPRTDAPESYVFWSGIFTIASAIRRKVWIPKDYLGLWDCYPFIYLMFVGPPGVRKTTTIQSGAEVLLSQIDGIQPGPSVFSKEVVIDRMAKVTDNALYLTIGEFSDIFQKSGADKGSMYEFFTSMFDGKVTYDAATISRGTTFLDKPCLNFFSATTPSWIGQNMPEGVIGGGFASRVIFVYEEAPRINKMFFHDVIKPYEGKSTTFQDLETDLLLDLLHIAKDLDGPFTFSDDGIKAAVEWSEQEPAIWLRQNDKLSGYLNRKKTHVAKLAMIHSVAMKDELVITKDDWDFGVTAIEGTEMGLEKIFLGVGKNKYNTDLDKIVAFVKTMNFFKNGPVLRSEVIRNFAYTAEPRILGDIMMFAVDARMLKSKIIYEGGQEDALLWVPEFNHEG